MNYKQPKVLAKYKIKNDYALAHSAFGDFCWGFKIAVVLGFFCLPFVDI